MVTVADVAGGGFAVHLDGKPVKTPIGKALRVFQHDLALAMASEWSAQAEEIEPDSMGLTQLAATMMDHVMLSRAEMTDRLMAYLDTDLLCYRAKEPPEVAQAQAASWDSHLSWFSHRYGTTLLTTHDIAALAQPDAAHAASRADIESMRAERFTVLQSVTPLCGSLVLGLAFVDGAATADQVFDAAHVEEVCKAKIYNEDFYGPAPHEEKIRAAMRRDLAAAARFLDLTR